MKNKTLLMHRSFLCNAHPAGDTMATINTQLSTFNTLAYTITSWLQVGVNTTLILPHLTLTATGFTCSVMFDSNLRFAYSTTLYAPKNTIQIPMLHSSKTEVTIERELNRNSYKSQQ